MILSEISFHMVSEEIRRLASDIFKVDPLIVHLGLIDLEGHVLLVQSATASEPMAPNTDRIMFYYQAGLRRSRCEHFNSAYGKTSYVHIIREKIPQMILYLPLITVYLIIDNSATPDGVAQIAKKIQNTGKEILEKAVKRLCIIPSLF